MGTTLHCKFKLLLSLTVLLVYEMYASVNLPLFFSESQDGVVHLPPRVVRVSGTTSGSQIKSSIKENVTSSNNTLTLAAEATNMIMIPPEPDPNLRLNMALAWTDANGTEISSFGPENPIHPIRSGACPVTSQLKLIIMGGTNWKIASLDRNGIPKTVGGDEFYVTYKDDSAMPVPVPVSVSPPGQDPLWSSPTAVAYVHDLGDGTYQLDFHMSLFSSVPLPDLPNSDGSSGTLTITMQYTCGVGMIPQNKKHSWGSGGLLGKIIYTVPVPTRPSSMRPFVQPNADKAINLGKYKQVLVFGDSNMEAFSVPITRLCRTKEEEQDDKCNMKFSVNVNAQLNRNHLKKRFLPRIRNMIQETIQEGNKLEEMALVVGSHVWDLINDLHQGTQFLPHRKAVELLLKRIQKEYPTLDLYWRSAMAVHTQAATNVREDWKSMIPLYYLSTSRSRKLYEFQTAIVEGLPNVTHLDVYHASYLSAEHMGRGDARHFTQEWHEMATNWFYK
jgi:hypothetical protein